MDWGYVQAPHTTILIWVLGHWPGFLQYTIYMGWIGDLSTSDTGYQHQFERFHI